MYNFDKISSITPYRLWLKTFSVFLLISSLSTQQLLAQAADDFSDGDFTTNPSWNGSTSDFLVNKSLQLQLNGSVAGTSYLYTSFQSSKIDNYEWEFYVAQSFAPSGGNFGRFYLVSDQPDLTSPLYGYYLQFGEAGSNDAVELFRQSGSTSVSVCRATTAGIAASFNIRVKVTRNNSGLWQMYIDYSGGTNFVLEASGTDITHTTSAYTGIRCTYTITNATRFYYDDMVIRSFRGPDTSPPEIVSIEVVSATELSVVFSEALNINPAQNPLNYFVSQSLANPVSAALQADQQTVQLSFSKPFTNGIEETLAVKDLSDLAGNYLISTEKKFLYFKPEPVNFRDVIITEIFADPSPQVGLPETEYVELYNRSENPFDLAGWTLTDETTSGKFTSFILLPGQYLILTASNASAGFSSFGQVLSLSRLPSLNNSGDAIILKDPDGLTIDSLRYAVSWYRDDEKADGGWSMELIDPQNTCAEAGNWTASEAEIGGTPGKQNSVYANKPDNTGPKLLSVIPSTPTTLLLTFDEKLEKARPLAGQFTIDPPLNIHAVSFGDPSLTTLTLSLLQEVEPSKKYNLTVRNLYDCPGNKIQDGFSRANFILPEKATSGDIIVNEILFNPRPTGVDFVEIYNRSNKTIDLRNWSVGNFNNGIIENRKKVAGKSLLFHPHEYLVFTENANVLKGEYLMGIEEAFVAMDLPPFNDDEGTVAIMDDQGAPIDTFQYTDTMHSVFIKDDEGISLERISIEEQINETQNWRSASSTVGFATPGYLNSNVRLGIQLDEESVLVDPEIFQPQVSLRDFTQIKYRFNRGGFVANVKIFDQEGRTIKQLAHNELLGTEGFFRWDGDMDNGSRARMGYYLVWFEIFDAEGMLKTFKKRVVIF